MNPVLKRFIKGFLVAEIVFVGNYSIQFLPDLAKAGVISTTFASFVVGIILMAEKAIPSNL